MRTTIDIDEVILRVAKDLAAETNQSVGRVLSDLARKGLEYRRDTGLTVRNGIPLLPILPGALPVTMEHVKELLENDLEDE